MVNAFFPVLPWADVIVIFEGRGKMLDGGIAEILRNRGDAPRGVGEQDGRGGHTGFRFFLEEGLAVLALKQAFRLSGAEAKLIRQIFQGQVPVLIEKIFFDDESGFVSGCGKVCGLRTTAFFIIAHQRNQKLAQQRFHLEDEARPSVLQFFKNFHHQHAGFLGILAEPEGGIFKGGKQFLFACGKGGDIFPLFFRFQIDTVFAHGVLEKGTLRMLHMGTGDKKRVRRDFMGNSVDESPSAAPGNIVDLIAPISVRMAGNGSLKPFIDKVQRMKADISDGKMDICVLVICPHDGPPFEQRAVPMQTVSPVLPEKFEYGISVSE